MSEWIDANDSLPDIGREVLIYCNSIYTAFLSWEFDHDSEAEFFVWQMYNGHFELNEVTHWQPLPEPPK